MITRSIFRQLLGAAIPLGIFPHPILLQAFGFHTYFLPIIKALKSADAIALGLAIDSPESREWFRRCGLHTVLKEKCWVMIWRNLIYKTFVPINRGPFMANATDRYAFLEQRAPGGKVESIPLPLLSRVFRLSYDVDVGWEALRIQSVVMSLVAQVRSFHLIPCPPLNVCVAGLHCRSCRRRAISVLEAQRHEAGTLPTFRIRKTDISSTNSLGYQSKVA